MNRERILVAVTGASGSIYAKYFCKILYRLGLEVHLIFSDTGLEVTKFELGEKGLNEIRSCIKVEFDCKKFFAPPASGSSRYHSMVIIPCTMGTLGAISNGMSQNLIHRAADCFLKEEKKLIAVVRESPFNEVHLENMLKFKRAGGVVYPAMPAFYSHPQSLDDMAYFFAGRIVEFLGFKVNDLKTWDSTNTKAF